MDGNFSLGCTLFLKLMLAYKWLFTFLAVGTISGFSNTVGNVCGFIAPLVVNALSGLSVSINIICSIVLLDLNKHLLQCNCCLMGGGGTV